MKKLLLFVIMASMIATMGTVAFAEKGGFVYSPSVNPSPGLIGYEIDEDCEGDIEVTHYVERDTLDDEDKQDMNDAYDDIIGLTDGDDLHGVLVDISEDTGIPVDMLLISDLFNVDYTDCGDHSGHMPYTITLDSDAYNNFAGLVYYDNGEWVVVDGASVDANGNLVFTYDKYGTFAVVVDTTGSGSPQTGNNGIVIVCVAVMIVSAVGFVCVMLASKKRKAVNGR